MIKKIVINRWDQKAERFRKQTIAHPAPGFRITTDGQPCSTGYPEVHLRNHEITTVYINPSSIAIYMRKRGT